jgi:hypothetical protein
MNSACVPTDGLGLLPEKNYILWKKKTNVVQNDVLCNSKKN